MSSLFVSIRQNKKKSILIFLIIIYIIGLFYKPFVVEVDDDDFLNFESLSDEKRLVQSQLEQLSENKLNIESLSAAQRKLLMDSIIDAISFPIRKDDSGPIFPSRSSIVPFVNSMNMPECVDILSSICLGKFGENTLSFAPKAKMQFWKSGAWDVWNFTKSKPILETIISSNLEVYVAIDNDSNNSDSNGDSNSSDNNNYRNLPVAVFVTDRVFDGPSNYQIKEMPIFQKNIEVSDNVPFSSFLEGLKHASKRQLYSTTFESLCASLDICNDTSWQAFRIREKRVLEEEQKIREKEEDASITLSTASPIISLFQEDTALQARLSEYHTVRLQLRGVARYTIFPTEEVNNMYLFPYIHSAAMQSQINFYDRDFLDADVPNFLKVRKHYSVELHPNDVLYIPPYYMIHTETPSSSSSSSAAVSSDSGDNKVERDPILSIVLDVISPSSEQLLLMGAMAIEIPFNRSLVTSMSLPERVIASQIFLMQVLSRIPSLKSPTTLSRRLYTKRFSLIYPENSHFIQNGDREFKCYRGDHELTTKVLSLIDKDLIVQTAEKIVEHTNNKRISKHIRGIFVDNFVEKVARWAMGSADRAVFFIRSCLQFDKYLDVVVEVPGDPVMKLGDDL